MDQFIRPVQITPEAHLIQSFWKQQGVPVGVHINTMVLASRVPVLFDTGVSADRDGWLDAVSSVVEHELVEARPEAKKAYCWDSNPGLQLYESCALPAELRWRSMPCRLCHPNQLPGPVQREKRAGCAGRAGRPTRAQGGAAAKKRSGVPTEH